MKLPNGEHAIVPPGKLENYCLDPDHERGQHKARVFRAALGLTRADAPVLLAALLEAATNDDATPEGTGAHGTHYVIDFTMSFRGRSARVRSAWIVAPDELRPRLLTCMVLG